jgi:hypothetical protein
MRKHIFVEITKRYGFLYPFSWNLTAVNINVVLLLGLGWPVLLRSKYKFYCFIPPPPFKIYISTLLVKWRHVKFNAGFMCKSFTACALSAGFRRTWRIQNVSSRQRKSRPLVFVTRALKPVSLQCSRHVVANSHLHWLQEETLNFSKCTYVFRVILITWNTLKLLTLRSCGTWRRTEW